MWTTTKKRSTVGTKTHRLISSPYSIAAGFARLGSCRGTNDVEVSHFIVNWGENTLLFLMPCAVPTAQSMWVSRVRRMCSGEDFPSSWKLLLGVLAGRIIELTALSALVNSWHLIFFSPDDNFMFVIVIWTFFCIHPLTTAHQTQHESAPLPRHPPCCTSLHKASPLILLSTGWSTERALNCLAAASIR